jgi:hypothetical protein
VLGTYVFLEAALRLLAEQGGDLRAASASQRPAAAEIPTNFVPTDSPTATRAFKGILFERYDSPASGGSEIRWLGKPDPQPWLMPFYGSRPTLTLERPAAYWIPGYRKDMIERLRLHGVQMETSTAPRTVPVQMLRLVDPRVAPRTNEGHVQITSRNGGPKPATGPSPRFGAGADRPAHGRHRRAAAGAAIHRRASSPGA